MKKKNEIIKVTKKIGLHLDSFDEAISKFSYNENYIIDGDMINYIEENCKRENGVDTAGFEIDIYSKKVFSEKEQNIIRESYKNYYDKREHDLTKSIRNCNIVAFIFFIIGAISLVVMHLVSSLWSSAPAVVNFALEIASWVFMWEAVDQFFIQKAKTRLDLMFYISISSATFVFNKESK